MRLNVAGFDEIVDVLAQGPTSPAELLSNLQEKLGVGWETDTQVRFRLGWLENLGRAEELTDGNWRLIQASDGAPIVSDTLASP